ncbi:hypothetical protein FACS1894160_3060 [Bacteroidia bacterium]|nr:hypothetical protein FACS1894160_3060 [Bacteroidia bacterium]
MKIIHIQFFRKMAENPVDKLYLKFAQLDAYPVFYHNKDENGDANRDSMASPRFECGYQYRYKCGQAGKI